MSDTRQAVVAVFDIVTKVVKKMTEDQLQALLLNEATLLFVPKDSKVVPKSAKIVVPLDLSQIARDVSSAKSPDEVVALLASESRLTVDMLKSLASMLRITIPTSVKGKPAIQREIADSVIGYRKESAAIVGGTWRS